MTDMSVTSDEVLGGTILETPGEQSLHLERMQLDSSF